MSLCLYRMFSHWYAILVLLPVCLKSQKLPTRDEELFQMQIKEKSVFHDSSIVPDGAEIGGYLFRDNPKRYFIFDNVQREMKDWEICVFYRHISCFLLHNCLLKGSSLFLRTCTQSVNFNEQSQELGSTPNNECNSVQWDIDSVHNVLFIKLSVTSHQILHATTMMHHPLTLTHTNYFISKTFWR